MRRLGLPLIGLMLAGAGAPDAFSRVVSAFEGAARGGSAHARSKAAQVLAESGATPTDGGEDLVRAWRPQAPIATPVYRNRALGPAYRVIAVKPGGSARFEQIFLAGQRARVAVVAKAPAAFRLEVTDDDGKPQCDGAAARGRCDWVPLWTTRYSIELDNRSAVPASYYVVMQ